MPSTFASTAAAASNNESFANKNNNSDSSIINSSLQVGIPLPPAASTRAPRTPPKASPPGRHMTQIEYKHLRFVVFDAPSESNLAQYVAELAALGVSHVVRACEAHSYTREAVAALSKDRPIAVVDLPFADGAAPPAAVIAAFLALCRQVQPPPAAALSNSSSSSNNSSSNNTKNQQQQLPMNHSAIGVHCVAGLGRAPLLVALALMDAGLAPLEAVELVRARRRGAFNSVQLRFLVDEYRPVSPGAARRQKGPGAAGGFRAFWASWRRCGAPAKCGK